MLSPNGPRSEVYLCEFCDLHYSQANIYQLVNNMCWFTAEFMLLFSVPLIHNSIIYLFNESLLKIS